MVSRVCGNVLCSLNSFWLHSSAGERSPKPVLVLYKHARAVPADSVVLSNGANLAHRTTMTSSDFGIYPTNEATANWNKAYGDRDNDTLSALLAPTVVLHPGR